MKRTTSGVTSVKPQLDKIMIAAAVCWTVLVGGILAFEYTSVSSSAMDMALTGLKEAFNKDVVYRRWASIHGGVYVPITEEMSPNPHLALVPDRDIMTTSGKKLTLINPAYMTRQVQELGEKQYGLKGHITSLDPLRPENAPDDWERQALLRFENGEQELWSLASINGQLFIRFMRPFLAEEGCLKCHGHQGIKPGEIRGGISVSAPWAPFEAAVYKHFYHGMLGFSSIWLVGLVGLAVAWRSLGKSLSEREKGEQKLLEAKNQWEATFDAVPDPIAILDKEQRIVRANQAMGAMLGLTYQELIGEKCHELIHGRHEPCPSCPHVQTINDRRDHFAELEVQPLERTLYVSSSPLFDSQEDFSGTVYVARDITTFKDLERDLRSEREQLLSVFDSLNAIIDVIDPETHEILYMNQYTKDLLGKDYTGSLCYEVLHGYDSPCPFCTNELVSKLQGMPHHWEYYNELLGKHFMTTNKMVKWPDGRNVKLELSFDISERKLAEQTLRESEERYRAIFDNAGVGINLLDPNGKIIGVNHALAEMLGYTAEELMGMSFSEITHPDDGEISKQKIDALMAGEIDFYRIEKRYVTKSGTIVWSDLSASAIRDAEGNNIGVVGVIADVTRKKQAEEFLQEREAWLRLALEAAQAGAWEWNLITNEGIYSEELWRLYGREPNSGEASLELWGNSVHPEDRASAERAIQDAVSQGLDMAAQWRIITPTGSERWLMSRGRPILDDKGKATKYIGIAIDISEHKKLEHALRSSQELLNATGRLAKVGGWELDAATLEVTMTEETYRILEVPIDYNLPLEESLSFFHEEDRERLSYAIQKALSHGEPYDMELRFTSPTGKRHWARTLCLPEVRDGKTVGLRGIFQDITERKDLETQLVQAQKMEALGTLAGGIAHDFNNLLQVVVGYSEMLLAREREDGINRESIKRIYDAAQRGADLVRNLLTFSRRVEPKFRPVDLNDQVVEFRKLLSSTIPRIIKINLRLSEDIGLIDADPSQIGQILMNLGVNARDAMPEGGTLTIETSMVALDETYSADHPEVKSGRYAVLGVSDTGHGMDEATLTRIFDPFFSTKEVGKGTGLGLSIVYGLVKQHKGHLICDSKPGQGTEFRIYFPCIETAEEERSVTEDRPIQGGNETILVVDDEEPLRNLASELLENLGYRVMTAANGFEAVEVYRRHSRDISMVILDLIMPEMDGKACLRELLQLNPDAKVFVASGYCDKKTKQQITDLGAARFLEKPFDTAELLRTVREVLDSKG